MTYTFRTLCELTKHLRALCELSGSIEHSPYPMKDFELGLPSFMLDILLIKRFPHFKLYIAFRTNGFESSTILDYFESRVTTFQTSVIACYTIRFVDGYYILEQFVL